MQIEETKTILVHCTSRSLVIIDELRRNNQTNDGLALASALLNYLSQKIEPKTIFAAHYHSIIMKQYQEMDRVININQSMEYLLQMQLKFHMKLFIMLKKQKKLQKKNQNHYQQQFMQMNHLSIQLPLLHMLPLLQQQMLIKHSKFWVVFLQFPLDLLKIQMKSIQNLFTCQ